MSLTKTLPNAKKPTMLSPSILNPPAWLGKIHGISFFTPTGTPMSPTASTRYPLPATAVTPQSNIHHSKSSFPHLTFVLGATRAQQLLAVLQ